MSVWWAHEIPELQDALRRMRAYPEVVRMTVACPNDHALIRVFDTPTGDVLLWQTTGFLGNYDASGNMTTSPVVRQGWEALRRGEDDPHGFGQLEASCACTSGRLDTAEVWKALDAGKRRVRVKRHPSVRRFLEIDD